MSDLYQLESQQINDSEDPYVVYGDFPLEQFDEAPPRGRFFVLCLLLLPISLIPSTRSFYIRFIGNTLLDHKMFLTIIMGILTMILKVTVWRSEPINQQTKKWFLRPLVFLGFIQAVSIMWGPVESITRIYAFLAVVLLWSSVFFGVSLISGLSYARRHDMARWLVLLLAGLMVIYILGSTRFAGFRPSAGYYTRMQIIPGVERLGGPLSGPTGFNFILLPALGYSIGLIFLGERSKIFWAIISFMLFISILITGSLGGILGLLVMSMVVMVVLRIKSIGIYLPGALLIGIIILQVGVPERLRSRDLAGSARFQSYMTALRAFSSSPPAVVLGVGQGVLYRPYQLYRYPGAGSRWGEPGFETAYGWSLKGSHSTYLQALAETGVVGFTFVAVVVVWVLWRLFGWRYSRFRDPCMLQARLTLAGCVSTMFMMIFGVFFFYNFWVTPIWIVFLIVGAETVEEANSMADQRGFTEGYEYL